MSLFGEIDRVKLCPAVRIKSFDKQALLFG